MDDALGHCGRTGSFVYLMEMVSRMAVVASGCVAIFINQLAFSVSPSDIRIALQRIQLSNTYIKACSTFSSSLHIDTRSVLRYSIAILYYFQNLNKSVHDEQRIGLNGEENTNLLRLEHVDLIE
jgi:hypothetical protein